MYHPGAAGSTAKLAVWRGLGGRWAGYAGCADSMRRWAAPHRSSVCRGGPAEYFNNHTNHRAAGRVTGMSRLHFLKNGVIMRWSSLAALLWTSVSLAQSPQLLVRDGGKSNPIELARAEINAVISGCLSKTSITLTFRNHSDQVLEGDLVFPLPENATVSGYALDVGGSLVDAVTVEKARATEAFESEKNRRVDPGLVEKVRENLFRTRIYPIPGRGTRTIRVEYISELTSGDGGAMAYVLPLKWDRPVGEASIRIEAIAAKAAPMAVADGHKLAFAPWENRFVAERHFSNVTFNQVFKIVLPQFPVSSVTVEKRTRSRVAVENLDPKMADHFLRNDSFFVVNERSTPCHQT